MAQFRNDCELCSMVSQTPQRCLFGKADLDLLQRTKKRVIFEKSAQIFGESTPAEGAYCIRKGHVRIQRRDGAGRVQFLRLTHPGEMLGLSVNFSGQDQRSLEAVAQGHVEACFIPRATLFQLVASNPQFTVLLLRQLAAEVSLLQDRLETLMVKKTVPRIAETLLFFEKTMVEEIWTRNDIAAWAGTTVENVIRTIADFEKSGILQREGKKLKIVSHSALDQVAHP